MCLNVEPTYSEVWTGKAGKLDNDPRIQKKEQTTDQLLASLCIVSAFAVKIHEFVK